MIDVGEMLSHEFMRNAFLAGTAVALACGLTGHFVVLRNQVFTGDALSHAAFTGALAALALGIDLQVGLFVTVVAVALLIGAMGERGRADDVVIGGVFAWVLGLGVLCLSYFTTHRSAGNASAGVTVLFGSIFGLDRDAAWLAVVIGLVTSAVLLVIARPLLFASVDGAVARARGVPVRLLGTVFLVLVALTAAEASRAVGALLLLALLAGPAAAAQRLTARPYRALLLSPVIAVACTWAGLTASYASSALPPSTAIVGAATAVYAGVRIGTSARRRGMTAYA